MKLNRKLGRKLRKNSDYTHMTILGHIRRLFCRSYHVQFQDWSIIEHPLEAEAAQVQRAVSAIGDQLGDSPANRRRLLQPVAAEAVGEVKVPNLRMRPQDRVLVERVVVVMSDPRPHQLERLEGGD